MTKTGKKMWLIHVIINNQKTILQMSNSNSLPEVLRYLAAAYPKAEAIMIWLEKGETE